MFIFKVQKKGEGFSLVEVLVGSALFLVVALAVYGSFTSLLRLANNNKARTLAVQLAAEQFEIIRNMPYKDVGLTAGIPLGVLPQNQTLTRGGTIFEVNLTIRNINLSTSTVEASDKLVEVEVDCSSCQNFQPVILTGQISPANLQSAGNGGALVVKVFNGNGEPIQGATVKVQSTATSSITNTDITNNYGILNIIGIPPGNNVYKIIVTKSGYSTDQTYPIGAVDNPNPTNPNITIVDQQVSQSSFVIDKLSSVHFSSVSPLCESIANVDFSMVGAKNIGQNIPKYSKNLSTNSSGELDLDSMEWDTYTITPTDTSYDFMGINPDSPFSLNPDNSQSVQLVVVPKNSNSLMVSIIDNATKLPISGASVRLYNSSGYDDTEITGQGYLSQDDWSGGSGQVLFTNPSQYFSDNGSVDTSTSSGDILLRQISGEYNTGIAGILESSTFDTGTSSNFYTLSWSPNNQPILAGVDSVKIQFATNASSTATDWTFLGPDGTSGTYYTVPGTAISNSHNGNEFARYKIFLSTETATVTPIVSNISFSYTSGCIPPGQVIFQGLSAGTYTLAVSKNGYLSSEGTVEIVSGWQRRNVFLDL